MARRRRRELIKADEFHAKVVVLLRTRHADWSEWEETFLLDNAQRPEDFIYSDAQWLVLKRLIPWSESFTHYDDCTVQELLNIVYRFRFDLDEDGQEFIETLHRWGATDLKRRQLKRLAGIARTFAPIGYDDFHRVEETEPELEIADFATLHIGQ